MKYIAALYDHKGEQARQRRDKIERGLYYEFPVQAELVQEII